MSKKATVIWQDSKIPNEIPLRAFAPLSAPQKFGYGLRPSLRMTHKGFTGYKILELTVYYGIDKIFSKLGFSA